MRLANLIVKEICHRRLNFALSVVAVVAAVALFVAFITTGEAYRKETRKIQLGLGQNLRIIPIETPMDMFWSVGFSEHTMPEEYLHRFASLDGYEYTHLTGTLQKQVSWRGRQIILTGILPEVMPPGRTQPPMTFSVKPGDAYVGFEVARMFRIEDGDEIELFGRKFHVARRLSQTGSNEDIRIYGHLHDVQTALNLQGRINEIRALECVCLFESGETDLDPFTLAERQLAEILPDAKVLLLRGIADVRQTQRAAMEGYLALLMPVILVACGAWIGVLAMMNVRRRRTEIGIMRALGYGAVKVSLLFLGRSMAIGVLGALVGFAVGAALALNLGPDIFQVTAKAMKPDYGWLVRLLVLAPAFAAVASLIPIVSAVTSDAATSLRKE